MRWPLRNQIMLPMVGVMLATLVGVSALNAYLSVRGTTQRIEADLWDVTRTLAESSFPLTDSVLRQMRGLSGAEFIVLNNSGKIVASSVSRAKLREVSFERQPQSKAQLTLGTPMAVGGQRYLHAAVQLRRPSAPHRTIRLHILYPENRYSQAWRRAVYPPLAVGGIALVLVVLFALVIASRVSQPLARLRSQVDDIAQGGFRRVPLSSRNDEILDLGKSVNRMAQMLAHYEQEVRRSEQLRTLGQLSGGIAHQMRNSVTGCRMAIDLHARECGSPNTGESLDVAGRQLKLMEKYLQRLLSLGKPPAQPMAPVEVGTVVENILALVRPTAEHVGVQLRWVGLEDQLYVSGDADTLEQLLTNLLLNAIEAAGCVAEGGNPLESSKGEDCRLKKCPMTVSPTVIVQLYQGPDERVVLAVRDSGSGPSSALRGKLFEPFVTGKPDGIGLGLSVAREIVQRHGGSICWERQDGWTCFTVDLPLEHAENKCVEAVGR